jgi:Putative addiction module component
MSSEMQAIFTQALALPSASKADLVELLLSSIEQDQPSAGEIDVVWTQEANDRFQAFLQGQIDAQGRSNASAACETCQMNMHILSVARKEAEEASDYYENEREGLGAAFGPSGTGRTIGVGIRGVLLSV